MRTNHHVNDFKATSTLGAYCRDYLMNTIINFPTRSTGVLSLFVSKTILGHELFQIQDLDSLFFFCQISLYWSVTDVSSFSTWDFCSSNCFSTTGHCLSVLVDCWPDYSLTLMCHQLIIRLEAQIHICTVDWSKFAWKFLSLDSWGMLIEKFISI